MWDAIYGGLEPQVIWAQQKAIWGNIWVLANWQEELYHELMIRDNIFKGNTPKAVTFDVSEYVCSIVGGIRS
jgi:hypothetical protein